MPLKLPGFRARKDAYPPDLWTKCPSCESMIFNKQLDKALRVCPTCGHHFRLSATARLEHLLDEGTWEEHDAGLQSVDALGFVDQKAYPDRLNAAQTATGMRDAAVWGTGVIGGTAVAICVMDFGFMGGSMGAVVGEKVTRAAEYALAERVPAHRGECLGWGADAGGHAGPHAAGQDPRGDRAAEDGRRPVPLDPLRPHDRWRVRLLRGRGRREHRRTERAHRVRRRPGPGRDHRPGAAAGLPAGRVPVQSRLRRPGRASRRAPRRAGRAAPAPAGPQRLRRSSPSRPGTPAGSARSRSCPPWPIASAS